LRHADVRAKGLEAGDFGAEGIGAFGRRFLPESFHA
jgi:hypothetical protein